MVGIFSNEAALTRLVGASLVALLKRLQLANDRRTFGDLIEHAKREIISHAVWMYFQLALSFRDGEDLLAERCVTMLY